MAANDFPFYIKIFGQDYVSNTLKPIIKKLDNMARSVTRLGSDLSLKLTAPIIALGGIAVKNFIESEDAIAQVRARLKEVGQTVGITEQQFVQAAKQLQFNSLFGDDQILRDVTTQLLTFGNISGEQFFKAQQAVLDLSTVIKKDLKSTAIQLGKALDNPVKGLTALRKSGIQFSAAEEEVIKTMAKAGRMSEAQALILKAIQHYYGGAAEAAGNVNPYVKLQNILGDLTESFGGIINEFLIPLVGYVNNLSKIIDGLSENTKKNIVMFFGLAAAIGPVLFVIGTLGQGITGLIALGGLLNFAYLPWILALTAGALLVVALWKPVTTLFTKFFEGFQEGMAGASDFGAMKDGLNSLMQVLIPVGNFAMKLIGGIAKTLGFVIGKIVKIFGLMRGLIGATEIDVGGGVSTVANRSISNAQAPVNLSNLQFNSAPQAPAPTGQVEVTFSNLPQGAQVSTKNDSVLKGVNVGYSLVGR